MPRYNLIGFIILAGISSVVGIGWQNEANVSICNWAQLRANIIRDTIYLDGGDIWWQMGLSDGSYGSPERDDEDGGLMYNLSLSQAFNQQTNLTSLVQAMAKNGGTSTTNVNPNYEDGVMFANDNEFILYGGLPRLTNSENPPPTDVVLGYEEFEYSTIIPNWGTGFIQKSTDNGVTRYITNGAGVSAPSENLGFYFSGMRGPHWGAIEGGDGSANATSNSFITVNMTTMRLETWQNLTLPSTVTGRANAELVWLPVSDSGVLVAIGGVINPEILKADRNLTVDEARASNNTSPTFMTEIPVYDVASQTWYLQNATGNIPPQLTMFCSVVAPSADRSSFNIYIYGGYDGVDPDSPPSDDVYILSIPSFTWIKAYSGSYSHGRSGHKCLRVYPNQMFVLGGIYKNDPTICLDGGFIQIFNLNTLQFQDAYSPQNWSNYSVPLAVTSQIGGSANGGATKMWPASWNNRSLSQVFSSPYSRPLSTHYPYPLKTTNLTVPPGASSSIENSTMPPWVKGIIGALTGLGSILVGIAIWFLWRQYFPHGELDTTTESSSSRVGKSSPDVSSTTEEINTNYSSSVISPMTGISSISRDKELETANTPISPEATMSQADSSPIFELDSNTKKWVELPSEDCEIRERPISTGRNYRDLKICPPPGNMPALLESVQNTPNEMQEQSHRDSVSTLISRPTYSRQDTMASVTISDIDHQAQLPTTGEESFAEDYDAPAQDRPSEKHEDA